MFLGLQFKLALEGVRLGNQPCFWDCSSSLLQKGYCQEIIRVSGTAVQACSRRVKARKSSVFLGLQFKLALEGVRLGNHPCFWDCNSSLLQKGQGQEIIHVSGTAVQACSRRGNARKSSVFLGLQFKLPLEGVMPGNHPCFWVCSSSLLQKG